MLLTFFYVDENKKLGKSHGNYFISDLCKWSTLGKGVCMVGGRKGKWVIAMSVGGVKASRLYDTNPPISYLLMYFKIVFSKKSPNFL